MEKNTIARKPHIMESWSVREFELYVQYNWELRVSYLRTTPEFKEKYSSNVYSYVIHAAEDPEDFGCAFFIKCLDKSIGGLEQNFKKLQNKYQLADKALRIRLFTKITVENCLYGRAPDFIGHEFVVDFLKMALLRGDLDMDSPNYKHVRKKIRDFFIDCMGTTSPIYGLADNDPELKRFLLEHGEFTENYEFIQTNKHYLEQPNFVLTNPEMYAALYEACQRIGMIELYNPFRIIGMEFVEKFEYAVGDDLMKRIRYDRNKKIEIAEVNEAMPFSSLEEIEFEGMILERN